MSGSVSGPGGAHRATNVEAVDVGGATDVALDESDAGAATPGARPRARSVNMSGLNLASELEAKLAAGTAPATTPGTPPKDLAAFSALFAGLPRGKVPDDFNGKFSQIDDAMDGHVRLAETDKILGILDSLSGPDWLATIDKMRATPSDVEGLSLLDKFVREGINDRNDFIEKFADQINQKVGLGLPTLEEREKALKDEGKSWRRADRIAGRELRQDSKVLLDYFNAKDKQGFLNSLEVAAQKTGQGALDVVSWPLRKVVDALFGIA